MSDDPHDQLLLQIRGAVAEYERSLIADRMRRGGKPRCGAVCCCLGPGRPMATSWTRNGHATRARVRVDLVKAEVVRQIFAWYTDPATPATPVLGGQDAE